MTTYLTKTVTNTEGLIFDFDLKVTSQSFMQLTSDVELEVLITNDEENDIQLTYGALLYKGAIIHELDRKKYIHPGDTLVFANDSRTIQHNSNGTKTISYTLLIDYRVWDEDGEDYWEYDEEVEVEFELPTIQRQATILTAPNFTDEENPTITYNNPAGNLVTTLEACISLDGSTDDIPYRSISKTGTSYTFTLTDAERNKLRAATINSTSRNVIYHIKTVIAGSIYYSTAKRTFTVVDCAPVINNPTVKDIKPETVALTGDENIIVKGVSMAEYSSEAIASKYATIVSQYIQCGNKIVSDLPQGIIDTPESGTFIFSATDSRGLKTTATIPKSLVEYLKPTCNQSLAIEMSGETGAKVKATISGNYFNNTFGAVANELKLELRHTQNDGEMGEWVELTDGLIPVFDGNTYKLEVTISGFEYNRAYTFQCRATDKLYFVESSQYTVRLLPLFDWGNDDFNFNVPVKMNGETVLRHNQEVNNTVLSGSGGHIYLRPNGTSSTSGEVQITPQGDVRFSGKVYINDEEITANPELSAADYIVETGTEEMGSNGTWYWEKWNSGKAVCWGTRNFGQTAITAAIGSSYRNASTFTQSFPSGLFIANPDVLTATMHPWYDAGFGATVLTNIVDETQVWFRYIYPTSITMSSTQTSFHIIGRWK